MTLQNTREREEGRRWRRWWSGSKTQGEEHDVAGKIFGEQQSVYVSMLPKACAYRAFYIVD